MLWRYLIGATAARTGDELSGPALLLLGLTVTGSASTAGWLMAGLTVSAAVGGPVFGVMLDRSRYPGRLLTGALTVYALALAVILAGLGYVPTVLVIAVAVAAGLVNPAIAGGWTSQLPDVLGGKDLRSASALDAMTFSIAGLLGPGLAGLVATLAGAPAAMAVSIGLVVAALPAAWSLPAHSRGPAVTPVTLRRQLRAGFRAIVSSRSLACATVTSMVSYVGVGMAVVCYPLLGAQRLGGAGRGALLLAAVAAAALLANAALARKPWSPDAIVSASTAVLAAGTLLAAVSGNMVLLVLAAAITGLGEGPQLTALFAVRHREAQDQLRAQIFTTAASLKITSFATGSAIGGPLATLSLTGCLLVAAAIQLLAALYAFQCGSGPGQKAIACARRLTSVW
jgi:MFS family permease